MIDYNSFNQAIVMQIDQTATFQQAIKLIDSLSIEDQTTLVKLLQERLRQQKHQQLVQNIEEIRQEVACGNVQFGSVADFLAEISD